jgi:hypothetical protein
VLDTAATSSDVNEGGRSGGGRDDVAAIYIPLTG